MTGQLKLSHVTKRFGGLLAVNDVSFALDPGEVVGLLGPNGSGKTTVLNMISGALRVTSGDVHLGDRNLSSMQPHGIAKEGVARTFQLVRSLPSLTVSQNVLVSLAFGRNRYWGVEAERLALEKLDMVGLADRANEMVSNLTYIDQKRMELARAIASEPRLLLLDEWLSGLNPTELKIGIDLVRTLQGQGMTILLVEHIMEAVRALCSRCVVMNAGALIADGPTETVLKMSEVITAYLGADHA